MNNSINSSSLNSRRTLSQRGKAILTFFIASLVYFFGGFEPFSVHYAQRGLDPSWRSVVAEATARGWQWGSDLAFTFGPANILVTHHYTLGYDFVLVATLIFSVVFGALLATSSQAPLDRWHSSIFLALVLIGLTAIVEDPLYFSLGFFVFLVSVRDGPHSIAQQALNAAAAAVVGVTAMAKLSFGVVALPLFIIADAKIAFERRVPLLTASFLAGALAAYVLCGQDLARLPEFLVMESEVIAGYPAAMTAPGSWRETTYFLVAAAAFLGLALGPDMRRGSNRRGRGSFLVVAAGLLVFVFMCVKAGFVRQDSHTTNAWDGLGIAALLLALLRPSEPTLARSGLAALGLVLVAGPLGVGRPLAVGPLERVLTTNRSALVDNPVRQFESAIAFLADPARWTGTRLALKARAEARVRAAIPLPQLTGSVDMIASEQSSVLAHHLDYRPRPSFQEYSTYTPRLSEANRSYFASARAPIWVIFDLKPIDLRHPALVEGASWPELLRRYKPDTSAGELLLLRRRSIPALDPLGPPETATLRQSEDFPLPAHRPSFIRLTIRPSLAGRLLAALYRPGRLEIVSTLEDGTVHRARLIAGIAEGGFVVSPLITNTSEFGDLASGRLDRARFVRSIRIEATDRSWEFLPEIAMEIQSLLVAAEEPN